MIPEGNPRPGHGCSPGRWIFAPRPPPAAAGGCCLNLFQREVRGSQGMGVVSNNWLVRDWLSIAYMFKPSRLPMLKTHASLMLPIITPCVILNCLHVNKPSPSVYPSLGPPQVPPDLWMPSSFHKHRYIHNKMFLYKHLGGHAEVRARESSLHPVSVRRFPSFRTQPLENLSRCHWKRHIWATQPLAKIF